MYIISYQGESHNVKHLNAYFTGFTIENRKATFAQDTRGNQIFLAYGDHVKEITNAIVNGQKIIDFSKKE